MKREELRELGLTDEQIEKIMAENGRDVQKANEKADKYRADAEKVAELQSKLDELEAGNMSEVEKANKELEKALARVTELEKKDAVASRKADAMSKFNITKEQADEVVGEDGELSFEALGKIISDKETASAKAKEQEIAKNAGNPSGGKGGASGSDDDKTEAEKLAETIGKNLAGTNKESQSVIDSYK